MTASLDEARYVQTLLDFQPRPIHNDAENARATELLMRLAECGEITPERQAVAEILVTLIEAYEERYAIRRIDAAERAARTDVGERYSSRTSCRTSAAKESRQQKCSAASTKSAKRRTNRQEI